MTTLIAMALLLGVLGDNDDARAKQTPQEAVATMNALLAKKDFATFYRAHCHKHMRDQIDERRFVEYMKSERGSVIVGLFEEVHDAIENKKGKDELVAQPHDAPDEYEFILVKVRSKRTRKGQQWHLELQKEDGKWKLKDTD